MKIEKDIIPGTNLEIYQDRKKFSYGIDSILLSSIVKGKGKIIDLGTGNGIIPLRIAYLNDFKKIYGIEIQKEVSQLAKYNVKHNKLEDKIEILNDDINNLLNRFKPADIDVIVSNPPYMKKGSATINESSNMAIARHEIFCTFSDIAYISSKLLKPLGHLYLIHRPNRLVDIFYEMRKNNIEPKEIRMVQPNINKKATMVLIKGIKSANQDLNIEKPLIVYDENGNYTEEIISLYKMKGDGKNDR